MHMFGNAVVTGAASGIGRSLAELLHARGTSLLLADVNEQGLAELGRELNAPTAVGDVSSAEDMEQLAAMALDPSLVCLNAGMTGPTTGAPWTVPPEEWDRVFAVN